MNCNHLSPLTNADKKAMDALGRDIAAVSSSRTDAPRGTDSPSSPAVYVGNERFNRPVRETPATAWDLAVRSIPRDETIDHEVEISLEYKYDPGDRRTRDYPGEPSHVTAVSAFLPEAFCRAILRNLAYELSTTSMRIRTDGGTTRGMLTEDAIHDFVRLAGEKVLNVYDAVQDVADDTAREVENPEQFKQC